MPTPVSKFPPVTPWSKYPSIASIPRTGFKRVEVEAIAIARDTPDGWYCARIVCSPEDGPLCMTSVYLREEGGGAVCIADLTSKEEAVAYASEVSRARGWPLFGTIFDLRIREVLGKGYVADPREAASFTADPARAALYHSSIAKDDLFLGHEAEHGRWISWVEAGPFAGDREAEKAALLGRVYSAAHAAMGLSAPEEKSADAQRMREMLSTIVERSRSDRLVVFTPEIRTGVLELLLERSQSVYGDESDEELCAELAGLPEEVVFDGFHPSFEEKLLDAFVAPAGQLALRSALAASPFLTGGGVRRTRTRAAHACEDWRGLLRSLLPGCRAGTSRASRSRTADGVNE